VPPEKSWNCVCKISRTWKVLENEFVPGISQAMMQMANAVMRTQMPNIPVFRIVHPGIAAIVYNTVGQACSIVVHGLCRYSTFQ